MFQLVEFGLPTIDAGGTVDTAAIAIVDAGAAGVTAVAVLCWTHTPLASNHVLLS